ncbi:MAG TPA: enoyl-CoA hydratase/isomerase family protein [Dehalococcoidia bacterium]|nr:enoyl-CoA hydratase/isomerase family protein [Dehalococcoidia bacterium]
MVYETIILDKKPPIAYLTFNRPDVLNSINLQMIREFRDALENVGSDKGLRILIITGAGRAFQAGADIKYMTGLSLLEFHEYNHSGMKNMDLLESLPQVSIAAVNGYALGGGLEVALACDIRILSEKARVGVPEVKLGILPGAGGTQRLPRIVGKGRALEMITTGEMIDAQEAYRIGLANKVVPDGEVVKAAEEMAQKILANGPLAVIMAKDAVNVGKDLPQDQACEYAHKNITFLFSTQDAKEGLQAFVDKRAPIWKGE